MAKWFFEKLLYKRHIVKIGSDIVSLRSQSGHSVNEIQQRIRPLTKHFKLWTFL